MRDNFWQENYGIAPQPVDDLTVWRAAKQMIKMFGDSDPANMAAQRAEIARQIGDMFNFDLWGRVANAVKELLKQKPDSPKDLN
jgi:hypothetical protein